MRATFAVVIRNVSDGIDPEPLFHVGVMRRDDPASRAVYDGGSFGPDGIDVVRCIAAALSHHYSLPIVEAPALHVVPERLAA